MLKTSKMRKSLLEPEAEHKRIKKKVKKNIEK